MGIRTIAIPIIDPHELELPDIGRVVLEDGGRPAVGCGAPRLGQAVAIVDPETRRRCASGTVGEIWTAGPSVALGYWGRPQETAGQGEIENPNLTLIADSGDFVKIFTGGLDPTAAFMSGKLKIKGDMGLAIRMQSMFKRP